MRLTIQPRSRAVAGVAASILLLPSAALADTYQLDNTGGTDTTTGTQAGFVFGGDNEAADAGSITIIPDGDSVNPSNGMLERPYYFNDDVDRYFSLTYSPPDRIIPLSVAVGIGSSGDLWHGNTHVAASQIANSRGALDAASQFSGGFTGSGRFTVTASTIAAGVGTHDRGPGAITTKGEVTLNSIDLEISHTYTLAAGTNFVKVDTTVKNLSAGAVESVNMWVGTSDDWIGGSDYDGPGGDSPTKYKGLVSGTGASSSFRSVCSGSTNAVLVYSTDEYVLMYGASARAILSDTINNFDSSLNDPSYEKPLVDIEPDDSEYVIEENDGSYALYLSFGDLAAGATSDANTWYFEGGELAFTPQDCNSYGTAVVSRLALACTPDPVVEGAVVTCDVTGGDPSIDILWEADLGGVFATAGVTLDELGNGRFTFIAPPGSTGRSIAVRLVDWNVGDDVAVAGEAVPTRLPAGGGPSGPAPALLVGALMAAVGVGLTRIRRAGSAA